MIQLPKLTPRMVQWKLQKEFLEKREEVERSSVYDCSVLPIQVEQISQTLAMLNASLGYLGDQGFHKLERMVDRVALDLRDYEPTVIELEVRFCFLAELHGMNLAEAQCLWKSFAADEGLKPLVEKCKSIAELHEALCWGHDVSINDGGDKPYTMKAEWFLGCTEPISPLNEPQPSIPLCFYSKFEGSQTLLNFPVTSIQSWEIVKENPIHL